MTFRIIQVVQELSSAGGVETVALELARGFGRARIANGVIASAIGGAVGDASEIIPVAPWLSRIPTRGTFRHAGRAVVVPLFTLAATRILWRHRDAVVLSHGDSLGGDILVVHAVSAASLDEKRRAKNKSWMLNPLHAWVAAREQWMIGGLRYRMFIAVSARVSTELQRYYGVPADRIKMIPNGIDLERFRPDLADRQSIRQEFGIPANAKLLLFAGHEFSRKGLKHVIRALDRLGSDTWLLVVGGDNSAPYRRIAIGAVNRVVFAGPRSDMPACYAAADAFVLPSMYETFSLVCMEALASGLPIFATSVGGIEDYLEDGVNGFAIAADPDDIAEKIDAVFGDETLLAKLRRGARTTAQKFSWDIVATRYIDLLEGVWLAKSSSSGS
jgi:glycosyltransferase involved in cell wall biosynthesis